ncbi:hypothetical protein M2271_000533 [Streptomyces sp. LBL]|nr:hypothetical protein [Streptomyces sp. LBL]
MAPLPLGAHVPQLVLHAGPDLAEVDRVDAVEAFGGFVGGVAGRDVDTGVVVGHVEATERLHGSVDRVGDLALVADVAGQGEDPMACVGEILRG